MENLIQNNNCLLHKRLHLSTKTLGIVLCMLLFWSMTLLQAKAQCPNPAATTSPITSNSGIGAYTTVIGSNSVTYVNGNVTLGTSLFANSLTISANTTVVVTAGSHLTVTNLSVGGKLIIQAGATVSVVGLSAANGILGVISGGLIQMCENSGIENCGNTTFTPSPSIAYVGTAGGKAVVKATNKIGPLGPIVGTLVMPFSGLTTSSNVTVSTPATGFFFPTPGGSYGSATACTIGTNCSALPFTVSSSCGELANQTAISCPVAGATAPTLSTTTISNICPATAINLTAITAINKPSNTTLTWHTSTPATTTNKITGTAVASGTYYAAFFDATNNCYSGVNGSATTAVTASSAVCGTATDTDGDGVSDATDLDSDNDGILDVTEGRCATTYIESFESPVETVLNGNNFKGSTYGRLISQNGGFFNIIKVNGTAYINGPNNAQQGNQYLDMTNTSDYPLFPFTLNEPGIVNLSAYFSNRDRTSGTYIPWTGQVEILNNTKTTVLASGNPVSFNNSVSDETWFLSSVSNIQLPAGTYYFRTFLGDYGHADNITICSSRDNDGDGIANYLDLDSDNDGCSDANEYYESTTADGKDNGIYGVGNPTVDATGKVVGASYTGNINNVNDANVKACTDTDNDGIVNTKDIDSDNDGITDVAEGRCLTSYNESFDSSIEPFVNANNFKGNTYNSLTMQNGGNFNIIRVDGTGYVPGPDNAQNGSQYLDIASSSDYPLFPFTLTEPGIVNISAYLSNREIFSNSYKSWTGQVEILNSTKTAVLASGNSINFIKSTTDETWFLSSISNVKLPAGVYYFRTFVGDFGHVDNITICSSRDSDGDGIPDYLELDSDNDGCSDAFEGGATNDKTPNYKFTGPVGTNGLVNSLELATDNGVVNYTLTLSNLINANVKSCIDPLIANNPAPKTGVVGGTTTGIAAAELLPTGGFGKLTYSNGTTDPACMPVSGATVLPAASLTVTNPNTGEYTITNPTTPGTYFYCIKICDSSTPTPTCIVKTYTLTITAAVSGTIDCSKTQIYPAPVVGSAGQKTLVVTINVTTAGCFTPITVSGSGMTIADGFTQVCATATGIQNFSIPVNYDGTALGTMNFTIGSATNAGSCSADLTKTPKKAISDVWTLDCVPTEGPILK